MRRLTAGLLAVSSLSAVACNGDDAGSAPTTTTAASTTTSTTVAVVDDGILRIGLLTPLSGPGADLGRSIQHAAEFAVTRVNESGGVGGRAVRLIVQDEGPDLTTATRGLDQLVASDVDAVIGPASNPVTLALLGGLVDDGVLTCSATASAIALDQFPDSGLFVRTVPSDAMAAEAMARAIDQTGRALIGVIHVDDAYGRAYADALIGSVNARALSVVERIAYSPSAADVSDEVQQLVDGGAEVVAVIGDATVGPRVVDAVLDSELDPGVPVFVNDALRGQAMAGVVVGLDDEPRERLVGVGQRVVTENQAFLDDLRADEPETPGFFATNTADCVNLIALAATEAGSTVGERFAPRIVSLSIGGTACSTFADCAELLDSGRNVDYDGPSGLLQLGSNADPSRGIFDLFAFEADGTERVLGSVQVTT